MNLTIDGYPLAARDSTTHLRPTIGERIQHHIDTGRGNLAYPIHCHTGMPETHVLMRPSSIPGRNYYWLREDGAASKMYDSPWETTLSALYDARRRFGNDPA